MAFALYDTTESCTPMVFWEDHPLWEQVAETLCVKRAHPVAVFLDNPSKDSLRALVHLRGLECLVIRHGEFDSEAIAAIGALRQLKSLDATFRCNDEQGVSDHFARLKHLRYVRLHCDDLETNGLACLATMPALERVEIYSTKISDEGVAHACSPPRLEVLTIVGARRITGRTLSVLRHRSEFRTLNLAHSSVNASGMRAIASVRQMQSVSISPTQVDADAVQRLQEALPHCRISIACVWGDDEMYEQCRQVADQVGLFSYMDDREAGKYQGLRW
ncbi:MAG: hypothetical protein U1E05_17485 [Patescibacteria group bacterium]|nr:hypothetical protein [Patescibacteria group bacterium]